MQSDIRILILGSGLLGTSLHFAFLRSGYKSCITFQRNTLDKNPIINQEKKYLKNILFDKGSGAVCNNLDDYKRLVEQYKPTHIIDTIPQPPDELVQYILSLNNCFKVAFSSPASDLAFNYPDKNIKGTYPGDKFSLEQQYNLRGKEYNDALIFQIGFIPEIVMINELDNSSDNTLDCPSDSPSGSKPLLAGLSFETMLMCNLLTGKYNDLLFSELKDYLQKYDN